ncbi:MAG: hypothetical protein IT466_02370 [Moraxellaceae bacterium]|nr:hypothetical protein [Moraxellaceae bacterium]
MTYYCKYHALDAAAWHCPTCRVHFCDACSPDTAGESTVVHYCPHCNGELRRLGGAHAALPFWLRLTDFLRYPLSPIGVLLMLSALALPVLISEGVIGLVVRFGILLVVARYGWSALETASTGNLQPPEVSKILKKEGTELAFSVGAVLAVFAGVTGYVFMKSAFYGTLLGVVFLCLFPLVMVAAGVNRSIGSGVSAEGIKSSFVGIGPVYAVVCLLVAGLFLVLQSLVSLFADILPLPVGRGLAAGVYAYFLMVVFPLAGYLMFQFQESLGFSVNADDRLHKAKKRIDPVQIQLEMMLKEGNYAKALSLLKGQTQKKGSTLAAHERYHKLLWSMNDADAMREHADVYFKMLIENGYDAQALALMRNLLKSIPIYKPEDPDTCYDLAMVFERMGDYRLAVHVVNGLHKDASNFARLPEAYLLAARLLSESLGMPAKAMALLRFLEGRYQSHASYPEIKRALKACSSGAGQA